MVYGRRIRTPGECSLYLSANDGVSDEQGEEAHVRQALLDLAEALDALEADAPGVAAGSTGGAFLDGRRRRVLSTAAASGRDDGRRRHTSTACPLLSITGGR